MINTYEEFKLEYNNILGKFLRTTGVTPVSIALSNALDDMEIDYPEYAEQLHNE